MISMLFKTVIYEFYNKMYSLGHRLSGELPLNTKRKIIMSNNKVI